MMAPRYARSPKTRPAACCCRAAALAKRNGGTIPPIRRSFSRHLNVIRFPSCAVASRCNPVLEYAVTGLLAWRRGQPGQVGNEAATAVFCQCRGLGSSPSSFWSPDRAIPLPLSSLSPGVNATCIRVLHQCPCMIRSPTGISHWCPFFVCPLVRLHPTACSRLRAWCA